MDVLYFLQQRTKFIRNFYSVSSQPFLDTINRIEAQLEPFVPPYAEDSEPAFLIEWLEAGTSLQVLGRTCISMLSGSLKLYFNTWEGQLGPRRKGRSETAPKRSFLGVYEARFGAELGVDWSACPANLSVLEQIILARNQDQHPASITSFNVRHDKRTLGQCPQPFFVHKDEVRFLIDPESPGQYLMDPTLHISEASLFASIDEVERLAMWLDPLLTAAKYRLRT